MEIMIVHLMQVIEDLTYTSLVPNPLHAYMYMHACMHVHARKCLIKRVALSCPQGT